LREAAGTEANLMGPILQAVKARATLGEICGAMKETFGVYVPKR
jgi:methylmalonyl-CoA mutase N-terminal domain/subunit